jgi:hypothetical protein
MTGLYLIFCAGKNKPAIYIFDDLVKNFQTNTFNSIKIDLQNVHQVRLNQKDIDALIKLKDFLKSAEFNLPVRCFRESIILRKQIEVFLLKVVDARIWNKKHNYHYLSVHALGNLYIPNKTKFDKYSFFVKYSKELIKDNERISKKADHFYDLLTKDWVW